MTRTAHSAGPLHPDFSEVVSSKMSYLAKVVTYCCSYPWFSHEADGMVQLSPGCWSENARRDDPDWVSTTTVLVVNARYCVHISRFREWWEFVEGAEEAWGSPPPRGLLFGRDPRGSMQALYLSAAASPASTASTAKAFRIQEDRGARLSQTQISGLASVQDETVCSRSTDPCGGVLASPWRPRATGVRC